MNDQPKSRTERREEQREIRKDFESVAKAIKQELDGKPDDEFKQVIIEAVQYMDLNPHPNNLISALMVKSSMESKERGDVNGARLMLFMSGVLIHDEMVMQALATLGLAKPIV